MASASCNDYGLGCLCANCSTRHGYEAQRSSDFYPSCKEHMDRFINLLAKGYGLASYKDPCPKCSSVIGVMDAMNGAKGAVIATASKIVQLKNGAVCKRCNCRNEYAGQEHLASDGTYTCYECK